MESISGFRLYPPLLHLAGVDPLTKKPSVPHIHCFDDLRVGNRNRLVISYIASHGQCCPGTTLASCVVQLNGDEVKLAAASKANLSLCPIHPFKHFCVSETQDAYAHSASSPSQ